MTTNAYMYCEQQRKLKFHFEKMTQMFKGWCNTYLHIVYPNIGISFHSHIIKIMQNFDNKFWSVFSISNFCSTDWQVHHI